MLYYFASIAISLLEVLGICLLIWSVGYVFIACFPCIVIIATALLIIACISSIADSVHNNHKKSEKDDVQEE